MRKKLDLCGWEKMIVNFNGFFNTLLPLAHNKICALTKYPTWFYNGFLGFNEGKFVMDDAAEWLTEE
jgi:hypothetical protein